MNNTDTPLNLDLDTIRNLLGELGIETLSLIVHGCASDADIIKLSAISKSCLMVKIPLLQTLGLIEIGHEGYSPTNYGVEAYRKMKGW